MSQLDPSAFYADDTRFLRVNIEGINYDNTNAGIIYWESSISSNVLTISVYSNDKKQSGSKVASGSATIDRNDYMSFTLVEAHSSGMSGTLLFDYTDTSLDGTTSGKILVSFTFDADLTISEKEIGNWTSSNQWEGAGTANCKFIRAHRWTTKKIIDVLRVKAKLKLDIDDKNLPDLFQIINFEAAKEAATNYCLHRIHLNQANGADPRVDPNLAKAAYYKTEFEREMRSAEFFVDLNADGKVDDTFGANTARWQ